MTDQSSKRGAGYVQSAFVGASSFAPIAASSSPAVRPGWRLAAGISASGRSIAARPACVPWCATLMARWYLVLQNLSTQVAKRRGEPVGANTPPLPSLV